MTEIERRVITPEDGADLFYDPDRGRVVYADGSALEWTPAGAWAPVCPVDDVAMGAYDDAGRLCCDVRGGLAVAS